MRNDWLTEAMRLHREGRPFVLATVVARRPPQSAYAGARAVILPDGSMTGWIGGGCVRPTVLHEALAALADGRPRLVRVAPDGEPDTRDGVRTYPMVCHGEGAVDVYIDPVLPAPRLVVLGATPVAEALSRLAEPLGFRVRVAHPAADPERFPTVERVLAEFSEAVRDVEPADFVVVATMGAGDEEALEAALSVDAAYIGLVASRKKAAALFALLEDRGVPGERIERVVCPAGLDLGGTTAAEVALSILAEIVQRRATAARHAAGEPLTATDPVCGMAVEVRAARHTSSHDGRTFYFCCPHCKAAFEREPDRYAVAAG